MPVPYLAPSGDRLFLEGEPHASLLIRAQDPSPLIEACFSAGIRRVLLYPSNLTANFFDLSSGEAGEILQKLRGFRIRVAVVCPPGSVRFSNRFPEILSEVSDFFRVFETADPARDWLRTA